jgi:hypothetical protein
MPRNENVERVAETHLFIRPEIVRTLGRLYLTPQAREVVGEYDTYLDLWLASGSDHSFDMGTMIRLGTAIETGLRAFHVRFAGSAKPGPFYQRLLDPADLIDALRADCNYDLATNSAWGNVREIMAHRHLYAHHGGLVDESYPKNLLKVSIDIRPELAAKGYPSQDVYWFEPLDRLQKFIEDARQFFGQLP